MIIHGINIRICVKQCLSITAYQRNTEIAVFFYKILYFIWLRFNSPDIRINHKLCITFEMRKSFLLKNRIKYRSQNSHNSKDCCHCQNHKIQINSFLHPDSTPHFLLFGYMSQQLQASVLMS